MDTKPPIDRANAQDVPPLPPGQGPLPMPPGAGMPNGAPVNPGQHEIPPAVPTLFVSFVGKNKKGKQVHGRAHLMGVFPFIHSSQVNQAEELIAKNRELEGVEILNWIALQG